MWSRRSLALPVAVSHTSVHFESQGVVDSWYANNIAVEPSHQRRGIATMFMDIIFKRVCHGMPLFFMKRAPIPI
jgi:ribosomal protein S18 acetylase RimI-like enzyme